MNNKKGFTVYELIITISIIALMATFVTISLGTVYRNNVARGGEKIESAIKQARNTALTKGNKYGFANFYYTGSALYCKVGEEVKASDPIDLKNWDLVMNGVDRVSVSFTLPDGSGSGLSWTTGSPLIVLGFKQSTGEGYMKFPYAGETKWEGNMSLGITVKGRDRDVNVDKFGSIVVD